MGNWANLKQDQAGHHGSLSHASQLETKDDIPPVTDSTRNSVASIILNPHH